MITIHRVPDRAVCYGDDGKEKQKSDNTKPVRCTHDAHAHTCRDVKLLLSARTPNKWHTHTHTHASYTYNVRSTCYTRVCVRFEIGLEILVRVFLLMYTTYITHRIHIHYECNVKSWLFWIWRLFGKVKLETYNYYFYHVYYLSRRARSERFCCCSTRRS